MTFEPATGYVLSYLKPSHTMFSPARIIHHSVTSPAGNGLNIHGPELNNRGQFDTDNEDTMGSSGDKGGAKWGRIKREFG